MAINAAMEHHINATHGLTHAAGVTDVASHEFDTVAAKRMFQPTLLSAGVVLHQRTGGCSQFNDPLGHVAPDETPGNGYQHFA